MTKTLSQKLRSVNRRPRRRALLRRSLNNRSIMYRGGLVRRRVLGRRILRRRMGINAANPIRVPIVNMDRQPTRFGRFLRGAGRFAGGLLGYPAVGEGLGAGISRALGQGDYIVNSPVQNSLFQNGMPLGGTGPPALNPLTTGFRITHREYLRDVSSSQSFSTFTLALNPGVRETFPWLSQVARNFEEYKIHGMVFYLNSTSGTAIGSTNTALGYWGLVTQYDASDDPFSNKQECENYVGCQSAVPYKNIIHGIECMPKANVLDRKYIRDGPLDSNEDYKFYDHGLVQYFAGGAQLGSNVGELWVSYDIELTKPRVPTDGDNTVGIHWFNDNNIQFNNIAGDPETQQIIGTSVGDNITFQANTITFAANTGLPIGLYLVNLSLLSAGGGLAANTVPTLTFPTGITTEGAFIYQNQTSYRLYSPAPGGSTTSSLSAVYAIRLTSNTTVGAITFTGAVAPNVDRSEVTVTYVGDGVLSEPTLHKKSRKKLTYKDVDILKEIVTMRSELKEMIQKDKDAKKTIQELLSERGIVPKLVEMLEDDYDSDSEEVLSDVANKGDS